MNQKAWLSIKALVCVYILYISITGISDDIKKGAAGHSLFIVIYALMAVAAVCVLIISYRMYGKAVKEAKAARTLSEGTEDKDEQQD